MRIDTNGADLRDWVVALNRDTAAPAHAFWSSVLDPAAFRENLTDRRLVTGFDVVRRVSFGYRRHVAEMETDHFVAFLRPANGRTIVGLTAETGSGRLLRLLSDEQCSSLVAHALSERLDDALGGGASPEQVNERLVALLELIAAGGTPEFSRPVIDAQQDEVSKHARHFLADLSVSSASIEAVNQIAEFAGIVAVRQLLVCEVPAEEGGVIMYEMRESVADVRPEQTRLRDRVALALGAVPSELHIPLYKASQCAGYRLEVDVGTGNFVRTLQVENGGQLTATGVGGQLASIVASKPLESGTDARIQVAEHPSKTMLSSLLLSFATLVALVAAWLARDSLASWHGASVTLGDLGTLLAIVAVAAGGIRAVIYRGLEGRTLAYGPLISASVSALTLLLLSATLVWLSGGNRGIALGTLLACSGIAFLVISVAFGCAVRRLGELREKSSRDHPESPATRAQKRGSRQ